MPFMMAASYDQTQQLRQTFVDKWHPLEPNAVHAFLRALSILSPSMLLVKSYIAIFAPPIIWNVSFGSSVLKLMKLVPFLIKPVVSPFSFSFYSATTPSITASWWRKTHDTNIVNGDVMYTFYQFSIKGLLSKPNDMLMMMLVNNLI